MFESCEFGKLFLYSTQTAYYIVGKNRRKNDSPRTWSILTLYRQPARSHEPVLETHQTLNLSQNDVRGTLRQLHSGNASGLQLVCKAYGIIGCVRFLDSYYLLLVTKREHRGSICSHKVYCVADTALIPLLQPSGPASESNAEKRYRKLLLGLDMTQDFYFSYTYDISSSLQHNLTSSTSSGSTQIFESMFVWNAYLSRALREALGTEQWVIPLIHGFWQQRSLAVVGQQLTLTLVARRSRYFAGTRFQKRGVNHEGHVANDVETEQIVCAGVDRKNGAPLLSSLVQCRGSFPLYWNQQGGKIGKPDILLQSFDPLYSATRAHLDNMRERYGSPVVCLDLVKAAEKTPREIVLRSEFETAITYSNTWVPKEDHALHVPWDLNFHAKSNRGATLLQAMGPLCASALDASHLFIYRPDHKDGTLLQTGVVRTNCVDCLDRTNVAQYAIGVTALGRQLQALDLLEGPDIDPLCSMAQYLTGLYEEAGHHLARQYGGSEAHSTFFQRQRGDWEAATQSRDLMTSIRRFYSNAYTDADKQMAINLFLGNFIPEKGRPALWELDTDNYLHFTAGGGMRRASTDVSTLGASLPHPQQLAAHLDRPPAAAAIPVDIPSFGADTSGGLVPGGIDRAVPRFSPFSSLPLSTAQRHQSLDSRSPHIADTKLQHMLWEEAVAASALHQLARQPAVFPSDLVTRRLHAAEDRVAGWHTGSVAAAAVTIAPTRRAVSLNSSTALMKATTPSQTACACDRPSSLPERTRVASHAATAALDDDPSASQASLYPTQSQRPVPMAGIADTVRTRSVPDACNFSFCEESTIPAMPLSASASPTRRRFHLESLDKLIGQPPDLVHHVRLHAPTQRAHRSNWTGATRIPVTIPPERAATTTGHLNMADSHLSSIAEDGSEGQSPARLRSPSNHRKMRSPIRGVRRTQSTDSGLQLLSALQWVDTDPQITGGSSETSYPFRMQSLSTAGGKGWNRRGTVEECNIALNARSGNSVNSQLHHDMTCPVAESAFSSLSGVAPGIGPDTQPEFALTGATQPRQRAIAAPTVEQLLTTDANGLGVSPYLLNSWLSDDNHLSQSAAAEEALLAHYEQFIFDTHLASATLPARKVPSCGPLSPLARMLSSS